MAIDSPFPFTSPLLHVHPISVCLFPLTSFLRNLFFLFLLSSPSFLSLILRDAPAIPPRLPYFRFTTFSNHFSFNQLSEEDGSDGDSSVSENLGENSLEGEASNKPPMDSSCSLTKKQIQEEKELSRILKLYSIPLESLPENSPLSSQGELGEKREENCEKLMTRNITQWSYLDKKEDFDQLIETLNPRGLREKGLREALLQHYKTIVNGLDDNPVRFENRERNEALQQQISARKKTADLRNQSQAVNKTLYKSMEDFIEANLRDQILDVEDRIWQGGLGSVKIEDITTWRKKVENGIYDFKTAAAPTETTNEDNNVSVNGVDVEGQESETMEVDEKKEANSVVHGQSLNTQACKLNILPCFENSRPGTPVDGSFASTPTTSHTPQAINPCVRMLAKAVLEVRGPVDCNNEWTTYRMNGTLQWHPF